MGGRDRKPCELKLAGRERLSPGGGMARRDESKMSQDDVVHGVSTT